MGIVEKGYQPGNSEVKSLPKTGSVVNDKDKVDYVNHPPHYTSRPMECIDEMLVVFGEKAVFDFCRVTAWKYRHRAGQKGRAKEDMAKSDWYLKKAQEIKNSRQYPHELYDNGVE